MQLLYKEFVNVNLNHTYFVDGLNGEFSIIASNETKVKMKNFNILGKLRTKDFKLFCGLISENHQIADEIRGLEGVYFFLINNDPYFFNYTNLGLVKSYEEILYLTQGKGNNEGLHVNESVSDEDKLVLSSLRFNLALKAEESTKIELKNKSGNVLIDYLSDKEELVYDVNLKPFGEGAYEIWMNDELLHSIFASSQTPPNNCVGVIHLNAREILEDISDKQIVNYSINFEAPSCYWQYEIISSRDAKIEIEELEINANNGLSFSAEKGEIMNGDEATIFTSKEMKRIVNKQDKNIELVVKYRNLHSNRLSEMTRVLPMPDITRVRRQKDENGNMVRFAPTLIYV